MCEVTHVSLMIKFAITIFSMYYEMYDWVMVYFRPILSKHRCPTFWV